MKRLLAGLLVLPLLALGTVRSEQIAHAAPLLEKLTLQLTDLPKGLYQPAVIGSIMETGAATSYLVMFRAGPKSVGISMPGGTLIRVTLLRWKALAPARRSAPLPGTKAIVWNPAGVGKQESGYCGLGVCGLAFERGHYSVVLWVGGTVSLNPKLVAGYARIIDGRLIKAGA